MKNKVFALLFAEEIGFWQRLIVLILGIALTFCVLAALGLFHNLDLSKPLVYSGDALEALSMVKNIVQQDATERLNTPFGYNLPENLFWKTIHLFFYPSIVLLIKIIGVFREDPVKVINMYYIITYLMTSVAFIYAAMHLRIPSVAAVPLSLLYSFLPYHYLSGVSHLYPVSYYSVPLICLILIWVWSPDPPFFQKTKDSFRLILFNYKSIFSIVVLFFLLPTHNYFNFFALYLALVSGISAALYRRSVIYLCSGILLAGLMLGSLYKEQIYASIYSVFNKEAYAEYVHQKALSKQSQPISIAGDSEVYALRPVQLLLPLKEHRVEALRKLGNFHVKINRFSGSGSSAIGILGSMGFIYLLFALLYIREKEPLLYNQLAILNIFAILLATVGGLSSLISTLSNYYLTQEFPLSQARSYDRISVFIAFFCFLALTIPLKRLYDKILYSKSPEKRIKIPGVVFAVALSCAILVIGIFDQVTHRAALHPSNCSEYISDKNFIDKIERVVGDGGKIFQLPFVIHHPSSGLGCINQMFYADHLKGYIHSDDLKWTYGGDSGTFQTTWYKYTAAASVERMLTSLFLYDFDGIVIDRFGFKDGGEKIESDLRSIFGCAPWVSDDKRYAFFALSGAKNDFLQRHSKSELNALKKEMDAEISRSVPPTRELSPMESYQKELSKYGKVKIRMTDETPHLIGKLKVMADRTEVLASEVGQAGSLVYGPYWQLPEGKYKVTFRLRARKTNKDKAGTLEITSFNNFRDVVTVKGSKEIIGDSRDDWETYSLIFNVEKFSENELYEFLVNSSGQGDLFIRDIELEKLS
jgi:phosphoglycerol transferase